MAAIIVDVFATDDVSQLAPDGWMRGRKQHANPIATRRFEMVPGQIQQWEWVSPKAGILVYGQGGVAPSRVTGKDLFGNSTWGKSWQHGYAPLATLDRNRNGQLYGDELLDLWIWVDANQSATVDLGEMRPATDYVSRLSVQPEVVGSLDGNNYHIRQGAQLKSGAMVGTWDWWSRTYYIGNLGEYPPQVSSESPVTIYRWRQIDADPKRPLVLGGQPARSPEGYFRFEKVRSDARSEKLNALVIASISTDVPVSLRGVANSDILIRLCRILDFW